MQPTVALVTHAATGGGAGIACARLHHALRLQAVPSDLLTAHSWARVDPWRMKRLRLQSLGVSQLEKRLLRLQGTRNSVHHSLGWLSSGYGALLREHDAQVIHLHWINNGLLSLRDVTSLGRPTVWTLHDMWAFCGAEHYTGSHEDNRYLCGYSGCRPSDERGLRLNEMTWRRKLSHGLQRLVYVSPSRWMANQAQRSVVLREARIEVIPNGIDVDFWSPLPRNAGLRAKFDLRPDEKVVLFAAAAGYREWRKGHDLLDAALSHVASAAEGRLCFVNLGPGGLGKASSHSRIRFRSTGLLDSEEEIRDWYRLADVVVIPSRMDNFPNVALEAMACGVPCCAFDSGGVREAIEDGQTGLLVPGEGAPALARAIAGLLADPAWSRRLSLAARERARNHYSLDVYGRAHRALYADLLRSVPGSGDV